MCLYYIYVYIYIYIYIYIHPYILIIKYWFLPGNKSQRTSHIQKMSIKFKSFIGNYCDIIILKVFIFLVTCSTRTLRFEIRNKI